MYEVPACQILNTGARYLFPELEGPAGAAAVPWDDYRERVYEAWGWDGSASDDDEEEWAARGWYHIPAHHGAPAPEDGQVGGPAHEGHGAHDEPAGGEMGGQEVYAAPSGPLESLQEGNQDITPEPGMDLQEYSETLQAVVHSRADEQGEPAEPAGAPAPAM